MPAVPEKAQQFDFYKYLRMFWRRKWVLILPLASCVPLSLFAAYKYPTEYRSRAILEMRHTAPKVEVGARRVNVHMELSTVNQRMLGWSAVRDIVLSRKVDFGRDIDPDDRRQLEKLYNEVRRCTRIRALGNRHLEVSHMSRVPERNAALVNELVKTFTQEARREAQEQAKRDVSFYREKLDGIKARLTEVDNQLRDFAQSQPWLRDDITDMHRELKDAEEAEEHVNQEIGEAQVVLDDLKKALAKEDPEITEVRQLEPPKEAVDARKAFEAAERYFHEVDQHYTRAHRLWREAQRRLLRYVCDIDVPTSTAPKGLFYLRGRVADDDADLCDAGIANGLDNAHEYGLVCHGDQLFGTGKG